MEWTISGLRSAGFEGFVTFANLPHIEVPDGSGVYVVVRPTSDPTFLEQSAAGRFKGKNPTVLPARLWREWVEGSEVLYIGKADLGEKGKRGIRTRLDEFRRHGAGEPIGHWGGRLIWQVADRDELLVCWKTASGSAEDLETQLLDDFEEQFHRLPFANLKRGRRRR